MVNHSMRRVAYALSLVVICAIPMENSVSLPGFGSIARIAGLLATLAWLLAVVQSNRIRKLHPLHIVSFAYFLWIAASTIWSINPSRTYHGLLTYLQLAIFMLLIWDLCVSTPTIVLAMQAFVLGASVSAINILMMFTLGTAIFTSRAVFEGGHVTRYMAPGFDPNDIGVLLAMGVTMAWYLGSRKSGVISGKLWKLANFAFIPAAGFAILLTASRTAAVALGISAIYIVLSMQGRSLISRLIVFAVIILAVWQANTLLPATTLERISETGSSVLGGEFSGRSETWQQGLEVFQDHPVIGIGARAFRYAIPKNTAPHNIAVSIITELGIIGLALFSLVLGTVIQSVVKMPNRREIILWAALLLIWLMGAITLNWEFRKVTWVLFSWIAANSACRVYKDNRSVRALRPTLSTTLLG